MVIHDETHSLVLFLYEYYSVFTQLTIVNWENCGWCLNEISENWGENWNVSQ